MNRQTKARSADLLQADVPQAGIGDIAHEDPADLEHALPLVGCPDGAAPRVVDLVTKGIVSV